MNARARQALDDPAAEAAIEWMVLFSSGEVTPQDYQRFCDWRAADPRHFHAWEQMQGMLSRTFAPVHEVDLRAPGQAAAVERVVLRPPAVSRRKLLRGSLVVAASAGAAALLASRSWPLAGLRADLHTGTAQRQRVALPDGSMLVLNARTAVNIDFNASQRRVRLLQGEVIAAVAADPGRPFIIDSGQATARALGTRFMVRREAHRTLALVLEHSIRVANGAQQDLLAQGQAAWIEADAIHRISDDASDRAAWADGMLVANTQSLEEVIDALRPYRRGFIRISPAAAHLRVLGAFPLDDSDNVLRSLAQTMPITVRDFGALVMIDVK